MDNKKRFIELHKQVFSYYNSNIGNSERQVVDKKHLDLLEELFDVVVKLEAEDSAAGVEQEKDFISLKGFVKYPHADDLTMRLAHIARAMWPDQPNPFKQFEEDWVNPNASAREYLNELHYYILYWMDYSCDYWPNGIPQEAWDQV